MSLGTQTCSPQWASMHSVSQARDGAKIPVFFELSLRKLECLAFSRAFASCAPCSLLGGQRARTVLCPGTLGGGGGDAESSSHFFRTSVSDVSGF